MGSKNRVLRYNRLERLAKDKQSSLLGSFVSCEENEVLRLELQIPYLMGLYLPLDGNTNLKYKLLCFLTPNKNI